MCIFLNLREYRDDFKFLSQNVDEIIRRLLQTRRMAFHFTERKSVWSRAEVCHAASVSQRRLAVTQALAVSGMSSRNKHIFGCVFIGEFALIRADVCVCLPACVRALVCVGVCLREIVSVSVCGCIFCDFLLVTNPLILTQHLRISKDRCIEARPFNSSKKMQDAYCIRLFPDA